MPLTIRATNITGEPLADDYDVRIGGLSVGRIYWDRTSLRPAERWYWTINGVHAGPGVMRLVKAQEIVEGFREKYPQVRQPNDPVDFEEFKKKFLANPFNVQMHLIFTE